MIERESLSSPFPGVRSVMSRYHSERDITLPAVDVVWPIVTPAGHRVPSVPSG
jgi:hypothetical protein